jgi:hypothetical protein
VDVAKEVSFDDSAVSVGRDLFKAAKGDNGGIIDPYV